MKKNLLLLALLLSGVFTASAQYQRRVLVEEFTNASCPPCASQNPGFNAILKANHDLVTPVKYQTVWPGFDPMNQQNPSEVATRVTYYGVSGVPYGAANGVEIANDCGAYPGAPACLSSADIQAAAAITTPVQMTLDYHFSPNADSIYVDVTVSSDVALTGNLRVHVALVEELIAFEDPPGSTGEKVFEQIMRKMLPNAAGSAAGSFTANETKTFSLALKVPAYIYNVNILGVSAWMQNHNTKEVYQSFRATPPSPEVSIPGSSLVVCTPGSSPSFQIVNESQEVLTEATIRYRQGSDPWQEYLWTGNLATGAAASITLSNISITQAGINTVDVVAVSSNNGALQTSSNDGYTTLKINALFDPGEAMPYTYPFQVLGFPTAGWSVSNIGNYGWRISTGGGAGSTRSVRNDMFNYSGTTVMTTPKFDLSQATGATALSFDHAYATRNISLRDSVQIDVSGDCGITWTTIFSDGFHGLATAPMASAYFTPTSSEWVHNSIDISGYNGSDQVFFRVIAKSVNGNNFYLDNLSVSASVGVNNLSFDNFLLKPNPSAGQSEIRFELNKAQDMKLMVFDQLGTLVQSRNLRELSSGTHSVVLEAMQLNAGSYRVVLQGDEGIAQTQWVIMR